MNIQHKFLDPFNKVVLSEKYGLCENDYCIYCGLIIDKKTEDVFSKLLDDQNMPEELYDDNLIFCYKYVHEKNPCITKDELIIKEILE